mgnify:CR=1 FL=1
MRTFQNLIFPDLKCQEHGVYDVWPCPWSGCVNGIPEDSFCVESLINGEEPDIYTRRQWMPLSGTPYFSWDSSKLPNWFSVPKVVSNEARRLKLIDTTLPNLIYHYTSVEGFFEIVRSGQLWLSDYSYLNDTRELSHGADLVIESATKLLANESRLKVADLLRRWISDLQAPDHRVCVASFSGAGDSLSQWRAYGPIAIGFQPRDLSLHAYRAILRPVEYQRDRQRVLVDLYLNHMIQAYLVDSDNGRLERIEDVYQKTDRLIELVAFFKDPAFVEEQEYRLAFIEHPDLMPSLGHKCTDKRFRVTRGRIIPYVLSNELEPILPSGRDLEIKEVVLGPGCDTTLNRGVREFLNESNLSEVEVKSSSAPYRT